MSSDIQLNNPYPIPIDTRIYQLRFKISVVYDLKY